MKKILLGLLLISGVVLPCFSSAATISIPSTSWNGNINDTPFDDYLLYRRQNVTYDGTNTISISNNYDFICMRVGSNNNSSCKFSLNQSNWYSFADTSLGCLSTHTFYVQGNSCSFSAYFFKETDDIMPLPMTSLECQSEYSLIPVSSVDQNYCTTNNLCPSQYTSLECQSEYSLIPVSSVDQNYCTTNNLCPSCPVCPDVPVYSGSISNLYINDILHLGAPIIKMNIPEEIDWDYAYTNSGTMMNIDVVGYNQDTEYINGLIDINNYKPTSEDFSKTFSLFGSFSGLLVSCLFVILVFYFIKKLF